MSMRQLIDYIERNKNTNPHWASQTKVIGEQKNIKYCMLKDFSTSLSEITGGEITLMHKNKTKNKKRIMVPEDIKLRIKNVYADDYRIIEWA